MRLSLGGSGTFARRSLPAMFALTLYAFTLTGCSLIGYGGGSTLDINRARRDVRHLAPGTKVEVRLQSGDLLHGVFAGAASVPWDEYETRFDHWRKATRTVPRPPALGDAVELALASGGFEFGRFAGLVTGEVLLADDEVNERAIATRLLASPWGRGTSISPSALGTALTRAPRRDAILLSTSGGNRILPAEEVRSISLPRRATGRWTGTLIGVAADALIVGVIVSFSGSAPIFSFQ